MKSGPKKALTESRQFEKYGEKRFMHWLLENKMLLEQVYNSLPTVINDVVREDEIKDLSEIIHQITLGGFY